VVRAYRPSGRRYTCALAWPRVWVVAVVAGVVVLAAGWLPLHDAADIATRVAPILGFLVAITVVAELADAAQLFDVAAGRAARLARGRTPRLFALVAILGALTTIVLSLDTTAVLLTPVVLSLAQQLELDPVPFALAAVWLANTASLALPVSNLTNLLAADRLHLSAAAFAARMALPALVAIVVTVAVIGLGHRRALRGRYLVPAPTTVHDPALLRLAAAVCVAMIPAFVAGVPVQWPAAAGAAVLVVAFARRRPAALRWSLLPWRLVLLVMGLFLAVTAAGEHGLDAALVHAAGSSGSVLGVLRTAAVGAGASNVVNNLPAYLAVERVADGRVPQLLGLLVGTNLGPLVTLWASLATLLWRERCLARGVRIGAGRFALTGLAGLPLLIGGAWAALVLTS
jgi:arsenical pump membrane protein